MEDGSETRPDNLACLCPRTHDEHHRGLLGISGDPTTADGLVFTDRWGGRIEPPHPRPPTGPPPYADARWHPPTGERLDARWFTWNSYAA